MSKLDPQSRLSAPKCQKKFFCIFVNILIFLRENKEVSFFHFEHLRQNSPKLNRSYYWLWVFFGLSISNCQIRITVLNYTVRRIHFDFAIQFPNVNLKFRSLCALPFGGLGLLASFHSFAMHFLAPCQDQESATIAGCQFFSDFCYILFFMRWTLYVFEKFTEPLLGSLKFNMWYFIKLHQHIINSLYFWLPTILN